MPPYYTIEWGKNPENDVGNDVGLITFCLNFAICEVKAQIWG